MARVVKRDIHNSILEQQYVFDSTTHIQPYTTIDIIRASQHMSFGCLVDVREKTFKDNKDLIAESYLVPSGEFQ